MSSTQIGVAVWVEQPGSPAVSERSQRLTRTFVTSDLSALPFEGSFCPVPGYENLALEDFSHAPQEGGLTHLVTLIYAPAARIKSQEGQAEYSLDDGGLEKPIETHPSYKTCWNYYLAKITTEAADSFTDWDLQTGLLIASNYVESFRWVKGQSDCPEGWVICQDAKKPGVESYLMPAPVVQESIPYSTESRAGAAAATMAKRLAPKKRFGLPDGADHWLVVSASVRKDGRYWVATKSYQYADSVDADIYP
jgi:hypothetical protein